MAKSNSNTSSPRVPNPSFVDGFELAVFDHSRLLLPCTLVAEIADAQEREREKIAEKAKSKKESQKPQPFDYALAAGKKTARFEMPKKEGRRAIGFGC